MKCPNCGKERQPMKVPDGSVAVRQSGNQCLGCGTSFDLPKPGTPVSFGHPAGAPFAFGLPEAEENGTGPVAFGLPSSGLPSSETNSASSFVGGPVAFG